MSKITINDKTYEECNGEEFDNNDNTLQIEVNKILSYYKEVQKFPIIFEDKSRRCEVDKYGRIRIMDKDYSKEVYFDDSFSVLKEAVDRTIEIRDG